MHRARQNGLLKPALMFGAYNPTLFQGTAGLGYHLLRLAEPQQLPCVLLLE
jgi:lantibiotic modifying enzyme